MWNGKNCNDYKNLQNISTDMRHVTMLHNSVDNPEAVRRNFRLSVPPVRLADPEPWQIVNIWLSEISDSYHLYQTFSFPQAVTHLLESALREATPQLADGR